MQGRPPTPTALKVVGGNPGHRPLNKQEPDPMKLKDLTPPAWLPQGAQVVWTELAPVYERAGLLTEVDVEQFAHLCFAAWQFRATADKVANNPVCRSSTTGNEFMNPLASYQSMMGGLANKLAVQFGGTPAARSRIAIQPQGDLFGGDPLGQYLRSAPKTA
jgi:P27 family predicted phage terminase small subunit